MLSTIFSGVSVKLQYYFRQLTQGKLADTHNKRALPAVFFICVCLYLSGYFLFLIFFWWVGLVTNAYILVIYAHMMVTLVPSSTQQADTNVVL
jgi:hypothetical protein